MQPPWSNRYVNHHRTRLHGFEHFSGNQGGAFYRIKTAPTTKSMSLIAFDIVFDIIVTVMA
jgi:hypothetical protein